MKVFRVCYAWLLLAAISSCFSIFPSPLSAASRRAVIHKPPTSTAVRHAFDDASTHLGSLPPQRTASCTGASCYPWLAEKKYHFKESASGNKLTDATVRIDEFEQSVGAVGSVPNLRYRSAAAGAAGQRQNFRGRFKLSDEHLQIEALSPDTLRDLELRNAVVSIQVEGLPERSIFRAITRGSARARELGRNHGYLYLLDTTTGAPWVSFTVRKQNVPTQVAGKVDVTRVSPYTHLSTIDDRTNARYGGNFLDDVALLSEGDLKLAASELAKKDKPFKGLKQATLRKISEGDPTANVYIPRLRRELMYQGRTDAAVLPLDDLRAEAKSIVSGLAPETRSVHFQERYMGGLEPEYLRDIAEQGSKSPYYVRFRSEVNRMILKEMKFFEFVDAHSVETVAGRTWKRQPFFVSFQNAPGSTCHGLSYCLLNRVYGKLGFSDAERARRIHHPEASAMAHSPNVKLRHALLPEDPTSRSAELLNASSAAAAKRFGTDRMQTLMAQYAHAMRHSMVERFDSVRALVTEPVEARKWLWPETPEDWITAEAKMPLPSPGRRLRGVGVPAIESKASMLRSTEASATPASSTGGVLRAPKREGSTANLAFNHFDGSLRTTDIAGPWRREFHNHEAEQLSSIMFDATDGLAMEQDPLGVLGHVAIAQVRALRTVAGADSIRSKPFLGRRWRGKNLVEAEAEIRALLAKKYSRPLQAGSFFTVPYAEVAQRRKDIKKLWGIVHSTHKNWVKDVFPSIGKPIPGVADLGGLFEDWHTTSLRYYMAVDRRLDDYLSRVKGLKKEDRVGYREMAMIPVAPTEREMVLKTRAWQRMAPEEILDVPSRPAQGADSAMAAVRTPTDVAAVEDVLVAVTTEPAGAPPFRRQVTPSTRQPLNMKPASAPSSPRRSTASTGDVARSESKTMQSPASGSGFSSSISGRGLSVDTAPKAAPASLASQRTRMGARSSRRQPRSLRATRSASPEPRKSQNQGRH